MVQIRPFRRSDLSRVLEIEAAAFPQDAYAREIFLHYFRSVDALFAVGTLFGRVAGYVVANVAGVEAEIVSIAVEPEHQGVGLGTALVRYVMRRLRVRRVRQVDLVVRTTNTAAVGLYRRFGFRIKTRLPHYYEDGADAWGMARRLF